MKKLNAILLTIVLIVNMTCAAVCSAEDTEKNPYEQYQNLLTALDLMSYNSEGEIDNSKEITRAEFVDVIGKFLNLNPTVAASKSYFYDVPVDSWYTNALNTLVEFGIVDQNEQKTFLPNNTISVSEAMKMIVCLLGYRVYAEQKGGYPSGYNQIGAQAGLFRNMPYGDKLTNAHMSVILYNTLDVDVTEFENGKYGMEIKPSDENILEQKKKIFKADGIVESVFGMSLYNKEVQGLSEVIIDGELYKTDKFEEVSNYFGQKIRFYYREEDNDELTLLYIEPFYQSDASIEILSDDFEGFDPKTNTVKYISGSKSRYAALSSEAIVLKNGSVVTSNVDKAFDISNGEIKLVDSNNDKKYDVCMIYDFQTVVASNVNVDSKVLTYKMISEEKEEYRGVYDFSARYVDYMTVYSPVGTVVDFAAITSNAVLDIAVSEDGKNVTIFINSEIIDGKFSGVSPENGKMFIDGKEYDFYKSVMNVFNLSVGNNGKFKLNKYGKISYYEDSDGTGEKNPAVYIVNVYQSDEDHDLCCVKYYDTEGNFNTKLTHKKIKIDGEAVSYDLKDAISKLKRSVVILKTNDKDEIISIDTPQKTERESGDSLKQLLAFSGEGAKWNATTKMFGRNVVCASDAVVFIVPPMLSEYEEYQYDEQSYSIGSFSDLESNQYNKVDCYGFGSTSYCNLIVLYKFKYQNTYRSRFMMVSGISQALGSNDDIVTRITGYQSGELVSYDITSSYKIGSSPDSDIVLSKGDIITVGRKDNDGIAGNVEVHFSKERNWSGLNQICVGGYMFDSYENRNYDAIYYWVNVFNDLQAISRFIPGCPIDVEGNLVKIAYPDVEGGRDSKGIYKWRKWNKPNDFENADEIVVLKSNTPIIVYDAEKNEVSKGSVTDICTASIYDCPSQIFVDTRWGEVVSVFVVNNNAKAWEKPDVIE